jgi:hypothetical protein
MSEFGIIAFDRIGVGLALRNAIATPVIPQRLIYIEGITVIPVGFRSMVDNRLYEFLGTHPDHFPA